MAAQISKIPHTDPVINRQTDSIIQAVNPILKGSSVPDAGWNIFTLHSPWGAFDTVSHAQLSYRVLTDGSVVTKGSISTVGGSTKAPAYAKSASSTPNALVTPNTIIAVLPERIAPEEWRFLPLMFASGWDKDHKFFVAPAVLALVAASSKAPACLQFQGILGVSAGTTDGVAIDEMSLELNWIR